MEDISEPLPTDGVSESENPAVHEGLAHVSINDGAETNTMEGAQGGEAADMASRQKRGMGDHALESGENRTARAQEEKEEEEEKDAEEQEGSDNATDCFFDRAEAAVKRDTDEESRLATNSPQLPFRPEMPSTCQIRRGQAYIYPLWKFLLQDWFNKPHSNVYLATPFLDNIRLENVIDFFLQKTDKTAKLRAFFVRRKCNNEEEIGYVMQNVIQKFEKKKSIKKHFIPHIFVPTLWFHAKFIACTINDKAEVLITSANFNAYHFSYPNMETVHFQTMSKDEFELRFLKYFVTQTLTNLSGGEVTIEDKKKMLP